MPSRRIRTALYSEAARRRLAEAVSEARARAGWPTTAKFARATGRAPRAIYALENFEPTVGQSILEDVGRTLGERLAGWDAGTPQAILEGGDPPSEQPSSAMPGPAASRTYSANDLELALLLKGKGLSFEEILQVIDRQPGQEPDQLSVEPPTGTDR